MRGYTMTMAVGGHTEQHEEKYDRLVVAVSNFELQENIAGQLSSILELKAGEIRWIPRGATHATTNVGTSPATFITFEFD